MNSKTKGNITEAVIIAHLLKLGYSISIPFGNSSRYDLILDDGDKLLKIQCKTGRLTNGCVNFATASVNGFTSAKTNYKGSIDLFYVYCPQLNTIYKIPVDKAPIGGGMSLRVESPKNSASSNINWAKDYQVG